VSFKPPGPAWRRLAIGSTEGLPAGLRGAFDPAEDFDPVPVPGPHDWLANHPEPGQSYDDYTASRPNRPDSTRSTIYLQPLGDFSAGRAPSLPLLADFAAAFFTLDVELLPAWTDISAGGREVTGRRNPHSGHEQLLTTDILQGLRDRLPPDAFCVLGITMEDLYPHPSWNFVFGQASLRDRVGVYSFARYDPAFYGERAGATGTVDAEASLLLRRSCKVLAHETSHMFGIFHCVYFHCLLNGSNHLDESDARPLHLCPVDLRKLHHAAGFDVGDRYRQLGAFARAAGFLDEADWLERRVAHIEPAGST
jgi:archaemetzincin